MAKSKQQKWNEKHPDVIQKARAEYPSFVTLGIKK